jgi:hypothetical protein
LGCEHAREKKQPKDSCNDKTSQKVVIVNGLFQSNGRLAIEWQHQTIGAKKAAKSYMAPSIIFELHHDVNACAIIIFQLG